MKHPLREFLEAGELSESRVSGASEALLVTLRQTGAVTRERAGRGWKLVLHNPEALRAVLAAQAPGILEAANPVLGPKAQAVSRSRDAHTAGAGEADLVLLKAKPGVVIQGPEGQQIDVGEMTRLAGAFSFVLKNENDWTLLGAPSATVATVENSECFLRSDSLGVEVDVWIYTHGRLSRRLLAWLAELAKGGGTLVHLGDYDPVGLDEYRRLRDGWGSRVRLHLPDRLEDLFRTRSSRSILQRPKNQELLGRLQAIEASLPADAKEVLRLIRLYGAGLEQEVLVGPNAVHRLSKSRFIAANQCQLRLWNQSYRPELATPPDPDTQARMDAGREVGELARSRFPGVLVEADHRHPEEALAETARLLADPSVQAIHEAAFLHDEALIRVDSLVRQGDAWDVVETKSVVEGKDVHVLDACFQHWIAAKAGLKVRKAFVMVLDREYQFPGGQLDLERLFLQEDVTNQALLMAGDLESQLGKAKATINKDVPPEVLPGKHCLEPYECPFKAYCTRDWPEVPDPVEWLPRVGEKTAMVLRAQGRHRMSDMPLTDLNKHQLRVRECHEQNRTWVAPGLGLALSGLVQPSHYLDFETYAAPIPVIANSRAYEPVPVQWSCHTINLSGELVHREFLADGFGDPRMEFAESLIVAVEEVGSIYVYSHYEKTILEKLAVALPSRAGAIHGVIARLVDLLPIVKANVYCPAFKGSYSIKKVLPALVDGFSYDHLMVQDGVMAMVAFRAMLDESDPGVRAGLRKDLLDYCGQDTLAMVRVHQALKGLVIA